MLHQFNFHIAARKHVSGQTHIKPLCDLYQLISMCEYNSQTPVSQENPRLVISFQRGCAQVSGPSRKLDSLLEGKGSPQGGVIRSTAHVRCESATMSNGKGPVAKTSNSLFVLVSQSGCVFVLKPLSLDHQIKTQCRRS